jgi:hypothetical protein
MKKYLFAFMISLFLFGNLGFALATVLTFEDQGFVPWYPLEGTGYGGLTWDNGIFCYTEDYYLSEINMWAEFPSPDIAVGNTFNKPAISIAVTEGLFTFDGAYFTAYSEFGPSATDIIMKGYLDGNLIDSVAYNTLESTFKYFSAGFSGIDELIIESTTGQKMWVMDNMNISLDPVLEPSTVFLLGSGLFGIMGASRIKFKK